MSNSSGIAMNEKDNDASRQSEPAVKSAQLDYLATRLERLNRQAAQLADMMRQKPAKQ